MPSSCQSFLGVLPHRQQLTSLLLLTFLSTFLMELRLSGIIREERKVKALIHVKCRVNWEFIVTIINLLTLDNKSLILFKLCKIRNFHFILVSKEVQYLIGGERVETIVPLTYLFIILMAYYGPQANNLGSIKLIIWHYQSAIGEDIEGRVQN